MKRIAVIVVSCIAVIAALIVGLFNWPDPLFAHSISEGRLSLHSDAPFDAEKGRAILKDIETRIASSPLDDHKPHGIYVANESWRKAIFFVAGSGATGINNYPLGNNVFINRSDIDANTVYSGATGVPAKSPRTLAYYAAHEITHSFTAEHLGLFKGFNSGLPQWVREGYADYVAMHGQLNLKDLYRRCVAGDPELDFKKSRTYASFRMLAAFMLEVKGMTPDELLATKLTADDAFAELNMAMKPPSGKTCKG